MSAEPYDLVVLGAGPAGLTAALYGHRAGLDVLALGGDSPGGQVTRHEKVDNFPAFPGGVTGAELMVRWLKQLIDETGSMPRLESVTSVSLAGEVKDIYTSQAHYQARAVVIATGSKPKPLGIRGEAELLGKGVFYCATCDAPLLRTMDRRRAAVIGGGDTGAHTALALLPHAESVTIITRGAELAAAPSLRKRLQDNPAVKVLCRRVAVEVMGEEKAEGLLLERVPTRERETCPVEAVFVGIGGLPITDFLRNSLALDERGFIVTDNLLRTSMPGVFAAGDVRVSPLRQIVTAAADGALAAHAAHRYLRNGAI